MSRDRLEALELAKAQFDEWLRARLERWQEEVEPKVQAAIDRGASRAELQKLLDREMAPLEAEAEKRMAAIMIPPEIEQ